MAKGTVKWFNATKGYGFIQPQGGGGKRFVHISAVEKAGLSSLNEGQIVEYEEVANKGKTSAENLKVQRRPRLKFAVAPERDGGSHSSQRAAFAFPLSSLRPRPGPRPLRA
jgi:CspA family cold shock protein